MYIENTCAYALNFEVTTSNKTKTIFLEARRVFKDTGNLATTGITEISSQDYELLQANKMFDKCVKSGKIILHKDNPFAIKDNKINELEQENKELKEQANILQEKLNKVISGDNKQVMEEIQAEVEAKLQLKDKEIEELKAKLSQRQRQKQNANNQKP